MDVKQSCGGLAMALLLCLPTWAQEGTIQFRVYPPKTRVYYLGPFEGGRKYIGTSDHVIDISWIQPRPVVYEFNFEDPENLHRMKAVQAPQRLGNLRVWPEDGGTIVLEPLSFKVRVQDLVLYPRPLSYAIAVILGLLGLIAGAMVWKLLRRRRLTKYQERIRELGGDPAVGLIHDYVPLNQLGAGGFGTVTKAVHKDHLMEDTPKYVAIKTILPARMIDVPGQIGESSYIQRFKREAQILERLNHPNIVKLHLYELNGQEPYIVMDYVEGQSLDKLIKQHPQGLPPQRAMEIIRPIMDAIAQCHSQQPEVVHADLKPENIMLTPRGVPIVMDFGIANKHGEARITKSNEFVGSTGYAAPEATRGEKGPSVDQYALGALLFEMLTGERANQEDNAIQELMNAQLGRVRMLADVRPQWGSFAQAIDKMRAFNVSDRYASVADALLMIRTLKPPSQ